MPGLVFSKRAVYHHGMKQNAQKTALALIRKMKQEVEDARPPIQTMLDDIKMMRFKIRALFGDISLLAKKDHIFVEALWKLGKMDEIVTTEVAALSRDEQKIFFHYMENKQSPPIDYHALPPHAPVLEIEIIKERKNIKKLIN